MAKKEIVSEDVKTEPVVQEESGTQPEPEVTPQKPPEGFVAKEALDEERNKRKEEAQKRKDLEEELKTLKEEPAPPEVPDEVFSDEGKVLEGEIKSVKEELKGLKKDKARNDAEARYPVLKDKVEEFNDFLEDDENKGMNMRTAAKAFLTEKGLLEVPETVRKGLEPPTGGGQQVPEPGISDEEAEDIRKTDYKRYEKLIREGKIK